MGTIRRGKAGLKRYLLDRLHQVKEVFRKEINARDQLKAKGMETVDDGTTDEVINDRPQERETVSPGTQGIVDTSSTSKSTQCISSMPQALVSEIIKFCMYNIATNLTMLTQFLLTRDLRNIRIPWDENK